MRDAFALDPSVVHLNHGSFGAVPRVVAEAQRRVRDLAEANPMRFHRVQSPYLKERAREVAGAFLGVGADEVALVRNVTQATATVLATLSQRGRLGPGDTVVLAEQGYETVRRSVVRCCELNGASYDVVGFPLDASDDAVVDAFRRTIRTIEARGDRVALVVVDHIASPTGAVLPVSRICAITRDAGALNFVDAAHVPGQLPARPSETGADFWSGTWHKWGFAPRGTTALWVAEAHRDDVRPLTTGAYHDRPYPLPFDTTGTDDDTGWYSLADAFEFWRQAGGPEIAVRGRTLLDAGAEAVASALPPVDVALPGTPAPCMRLVPLPDGVAATDADADLLYHRLSALNVEVQVVPYGGRGYVRLSAAVYNEKPDYERLAEVLPKAIRGRSG